MRRGINPLLKGYKPKCSNLWLPGLTNFQVAVRTLTCPKYHDSPTGLDRLCYLGGMSDSEAQFSYDDSLLHEGKYHEWFWSGLDEWQVEFLLAPVKVPTPPEPEAIYKNQEFAQAKRWRDEASCAGVDPVVFFGSEGSDLKQQYANPRAEWRKYCPECPVRELCLELARKSGSVGIFGGKYFTYKSGYNGQLEYDDADLPRPGRPRKHVKSPMQMSSSARERAWREMQKEINDRISAAAARESLSDQ